MKRSIYLILVVAILFTLHGCQANESGESIHFYYLRSEYAYGTADSVIAAESRELISAYDPSELLRLYLEGPLEAALKTPFPKQTKLVAFSRNADTVSITLSDQVENLSGVSLSLACACLAKTVMEMTGAVTVHICAETVPLNGTAVITLDADTILLLDNSTVATVSVTE